MKPIEILVKEFDFKKNGGLCFSHECFSNSTRAVKLKETNLIKQQNREIAHVEVCNDCFKVIDKVVKRINKEVYGNFKIIKFDVQEKA